MSIPTQLNHYRILGQLGKGGMGEVYVAEDTRLHRKVAIKILSKLMAADPERRERFEREAQAVAALNHPNIVTIYSVEEADGVPFLTMELVEGRPLSESIGPGGLPLDALLRVGIAVSDAIAAAHQRGITHRDLKPGNVMLTADGRPKVLDFGLAKLREAELDADGVTRMPSGDLTGEGRIIGTVAYMSPEQAEGKPVDQRSDIFSLGVMLHEMGTGERPFKGDTNVSVISSILKDTPSSVTDLNPAIPTGLSKIIRRSLSKDPSRRYQTATDLRNELEDLKQELDSGVTTTMAAPRRAAAGRGIGTRAGAMAAAAVVALAAVVVVFLWQGSAPDPAPQRFEAERFSRLTNSGDAFLAVISGDGRYVVHIKNQGIEPSLWVRQTATSSDIQIVPPARVRYDGLTYSPDGDYVFYVTYELTGGVGTLYRVPVLGGASQRVLDDVDSRVSFSPDGTEFAFTRGAPGIGEAYLMVASANGSTVRRLASLDAPEQFLLSGPAWAPDGRTILAAVQSLRGGPQSLVYAVDVATGEAKPVGTHRWRAAGEMEWMPDGRSFVIAAAEGVTGPQIWQVSFPAGEVSRITNDLNNYVGVSLSDDAGTLVTVQAENTSNLWLLPDADISRARQITRGRGRGDGQTGLAWTPDGRIVFGSLASGQPEIWIMDGDGSNARQLTGDGAASVNPSVSPDGRFIVYQEVQSDGMFLWRMNVDGSGARPLTTGGAEFQPVVSADSQTVYYTNPSSGQPLTYRVSIEGGEPSRVSTRFFRAGAISPDGRSLFGVGWNDEERRSAPARLTIADGGIELRSDLPAAGAAITPDGRTLTYLDVTDAGLAMRSMPIEGGEPKELFRLEGNVAGFAWSPDGSQLLIARGTGSSDVVVITAK